MESKKEYTCDVCQKCFARDKALINHKNLAHPQKDAPAKSSTAVASMRKRKELFKPKIKLKKIKLKTVAAEYNPAPYFGFKTLTDMFKKSMKPCVEKMQIPEKLWGIVEDIEEKYKDTCGKGSSKNSKPRIDPKKLPPVSKESKVDAVSEKESTLQLSGKALNQDSLSDETKVSVAQSLNEVLTGVNTGISHGSDGKGYWCEICSRGFSRLAALEKHKRASHDNKTSSTVSSPASKKATPDHSRKSLKHLKRRRELDKMRDQMSNRKRMKKHVARSFTHSTGFSRRPGTIVDVYDHEKRQRSYSSQESDLKRSKLENSFVQDYDYHLSPSKKESSKTFSSDGSKGTWRFKYYCDYCYRAFSSTRRLEEHESGQCPVMVKKKVEKKRSPKLDPKRIDDQPKEKSSKKLFYCDSCGRKFGSLSALKVHAQTHLKDKRFPCEFCGLGFADNKELARHRLDHNYDSEHRCFMCNKLFLEKEELLQHELLHKTNEDTFCSVKILGPTEAPGKPGFLEVLELGSVIEDVIERKRKELENSIGFYRAV